MTRKPKKVPDFKSEEAERCFWATHDSSEYLDWSGAQPVRLPNVKPSTETISLRLLFSFGLLLAGIGLLWPWPSKLPLGRLPGDIINHRPGFKLFAPFTTMIVMSLVLSLILWLLRR